MSNELKKIVKKIQFKTDKTIEEIANDIGYARAYFTNQVNVGTNKNLKGLLEKYLLDYEQNVMSEDISPEPPIAQVNEDPVEYNKALQLGNIKITVQDYIDELRIDKKKLQNTIDTNLTAMIQLLGALSRHDRAFHDTMLKSLARLEKRPENELIGEARSFEAAKQLEEQTGGKLTDGHT